MFSLNLESWGLPLYPNEYEEDRKSVSSEDGCNTSNEFNSFSSTAPSGGEEVESPKSIQKKPLPVSSTLSTDPTRNVLQELQKKADSTTGSDAKKPALSYITLISNTILASPEKRLLLSEIYNNIMEKYPYYQYSGDKAWKNSIRHNLSLNECFIKDGRSDNGKGNYWAIHPACVEDFKKGDFRRRQARRRAKRCQQQAPPGYQQTVTMGTNYAGLSLPYPYNINKFPAPGYPTSTYQSSYPMNMPALSTSYQQIPGQYGSSLPSNVPMPSFPMHTMSSMAPMESVSRIPSYNSYLQSHSGPSSMAPPNVSTAQLTAMGSYGSSPSQFYQPRSVSHGVMNNFNGLYR